ncbi:hypothetical protein [Heliophilum fasciatum]|uniref:Uncharacterized protein n=1 Tax=Heliophilum fasciatum TaxID=35700 RepID=A0A4R2RIB0_9FIRM|nr:hypothetical protein [Heliophilum fasciatum]MCW2278555.1 hypothetical protein [Heliophilum fasciatum]TCP63510.1 hypothetical protein EDD73_11853 [Heliophilum fasciatum]
MTESNQPWLTNTEQVKWVVEYGQSHASHPLNITLRDWPQAIRRALASKDDLGPSQNLYFAAAILASAFAEKNKSDYDHSDSHLLFILSHALFIEITQIELEEMNCIKFKGVHCPKENQQWPGPVAAFFSMWQEAITQETVLDAWMNEFFWSVHMDITLLSKKGGEKEAHVNPAIGTLIHETSKAAYMIQAHEEAQKEND